MRLGGYYWLSPLKQGADKRENCELHNLELDKAFNLFLNIFKVTP